MKHSPGSVVALARNLFFAAETPEDRWRPLTKYVAILLLFVATRAFVFGMFELRGMDIHAEMADSTCYIASAQFIETHGHLSTEINWRYRVFAGLPLLMAAANLVIGNMVASGFFVVVLSGLLGLFLIQHWFNRLRMTLIATVFLPYSIATTSWIFSEAPALFCVIITGWAMMNLRDRPAMLCLCLLIGGFGIVIRHTAILLIIPTVFILAWKLPSGSLARATLLCTVTGVPLAIYLCWNWLTIHQLVPQTKLDQMDMLEAARRNPRYSTSVFNPPFCALWEGLTDPHERLGKKISVLGAAVAAMAAIVRMASLYRNDSGSRDGILALAFAWSLASFFLLHISMGVTVGYQWLDRYLSQANLMIDWAFFCHLPLRWAWIVVLIVGGSLFASMTGFGPHSPGFIR